MIKKLKQILFLPDKIYNKFIFSYRKVNYEKFPKISGRLYLVSDKKSIFLGRDVCINSSFKSNPIGGSDRTILFARPGAKITIGNNVGISNSTIFAASSVIIGNDVMIGGDCRIYDTDFHSINYDHRLQKPDINIKSKPIVISNGVFIGAHSIILKGVSIGEKSVIAAGSIVTKDIPSNELWGGVPAKFIKRINN